MSEQFLSSGADCEASSGATFTVTIGATVPTGFEHTAAEEVNEKIGVVAKISKDRGRIYFPITTDNLFQVMCSFKKGRVLCFTSIENSKAFSFVLLCFRDKFNYTIVNENVCPYP